MRFRNNPPPKPDLTKWVGEFNIKQEILRETIMTLVIEILSCLVVAALFYGLAFAVMGQY